MNAPVRRPPPGADRSPATALADLLAARRAGVGAIAVVAVAAGLAWYAWHRHAADVRAHPDAVLFPAAVELRGSAPWVRGDIRAEALRDASLDAGLPLDDPDLPERLRRAFARHPWVREVVRVDVRSPAAATVEVRCREPVAMVRVKGGLYAVDAEGTVLPSDDFTPEAAAAYPTIASVQSTPQGAAGTPWRDPVVTEGAALAAALGPEWPALGVRDLQPKGSAVGISWDLVGDGGRVIRFGFAPGRERAGEPPAAAKVARLRDLATREALDGGVDLAIPPTESPVPVSGADPARASGPP